MPANRLKQYKTYQVPLENYYHSLGFCFGCYIPLYGHGSLFLIQDCDSFRIFNRHLSFADCTFFEPGSASLIDLPLALHASTLRAKLLLVRFARVWNIAV